MNYQEKLAFAAEISKALKAIGAVPKVKERFDLIEDQLFAVQLANSAASIAPASIKTADYENPFDALRAQMKVTFPDIPSGAIVATAHLVDCIRMTPAFIANIHDFELEAGHYAVGRFAWMLEDVTPLPEPIVTRGYQGLWDWDEVAS